MTGPNPRSPRPTAPPTTSYRRAHGAWLDHQLDRPTADAGSLLDHPDNPRHPVPCARRPGPPPMATRGGATSSTAFLWHAALAWSAGAALPFRVPHRRARRCLGARPLREWARYDRLTVVIVRPRRGQACDRSASGRRLPSERWLPSCSTGIRSSRWPTTWPAAAGRRSPAAVEVGEEAVIGEITASGLLERRRRLPHRPEVDGHPRGRAGPPLRGVQRRRGRAGHVQGPGALLRQTRTGCSEGWPSPPSRSVPRRPTSPPRRATSGRRSGCRPPSPRSGGRACSPTGHHQPGAGPDEYLFGEEKAMLEVIEGHAAAPRWLPPYEHGLFATDCRPGGRRRPHPRRPKGQPNPTLVNNVETLANVPHILARGRRLVPVDGHRGVARHDRGHRRRRRRRSRRRRDRAGHPAVGRDRRGRAGSARRPARARRCSPASPTPSITADAARRPGELRGLPGDRQRHGSAGFIVYDDTACMVEVAYRAVAVPLRRVVRPVPAVQVRQRRDHPHLDSIEAGDGPTTTTSR